MKRMLLAVVLMGCASGRTTAGGQADATADAPAAGDGAAAADGAASADAPPGPDGSVPGGADAAMADAAMADAAMADASTCPTQPCDILARCGCATGQACDLDTTDLVGTRCRGVAAPGRESSTCASLSDCDQGYVCLGSGAGTQQSCEKYCGSNADCAAPRGQCVIDIVNGTTPIPGVPSVCSSNCDPLNSGGGVCPAGWKCDFFTQNHAGATYSIVDCTPSTGAGGQGASCQAASGTGGDESKCAPNYSCTTDNGTTFACRKICNFTLNTGCVGAQVCFNFSTPLVVGGTEYGVCN